MGIIGKKDKCATRIGIEPMTYRLTADSAYKGNNQKCQCQGIISDEKNYFYLRSNQLS